MREIKKEEELAAIGVEWLKSIGFEVYQEVFNGWGSRTDIVGKLGKLLWGIEVKTNLSLAVIHQAYQNKQRYHLSSIFVPHTKGCDSFGRIVCDRLGVGMLTCYAESIYGKYTSGIRGWGPIGERYYIAEEVKSHFHRKIHPPKLNEKQKDYSNAGNNRGEFWSPFKTTKESLIEYVKEHPDCLLRDALKNIKHHYREISTASTCIREWIGRGIIKELKIEKREGKLYLKLREVNN